MPPDTRLHNALPGMIIIATETTAPDGTITRRLEMRPAAQPERRPAPAGGWPQGNGLTPEESERRDREWLRGWENVGEGRPVCMAVRRGRGGVGTIPDTF